MLRLVGHGFSTPALPASGEGANLSPCELGSSEGGYPCAKVHHVFDSLGYGNGVDLMSGGADLLWIASRGRGVLG